MAKNALILDGYSPIFSRMRFFTSSKVQLFQFDPIPDFLRQCRSLLTQNKLSKLLIDPEVDEKVSKAVEVEQVEEVL